MALDANIKSTSLFNLKSSLAVIGALIFSTMMCAGNADPVLTKKSKESAGPDIAEIIGEEPFPVIPGENTPVVITPIEEISPTTPINNDPVTETAPVGPNNIPTGTYDWLKTYHFNQMDAALSMQKTPDNGFILVGVNRKSNNPYENDVVIIKTDSKGQKIWSKTLGEQGATASEIGTAVQNHPDGGYLILANTRDSHFGAHTTGHRAVVIKLDSRGQEQWVKPYGDNGFLKEFGSIEKTYDQDKKLDGFIMAGLEQEIVGKDAKLYVTKINLDGDVLWQKYPPFEELDSANGKIKAKQDNDGNIIVLATRNNSLEAPYTDTQEDTALLKLDPQGEMLWTEAKTFHSLLGDFPSDFIINDQNEILITLQFFSNTVKLFKVSSAGEKIGDTIEIVIPGLSSEGFGHAVMGMSIHKTSVGSVITGSVLYYPQGSDATAMNIFVTTLDSNDKEISSKLYGAPLVTLGAGLSVIPSDNHIYISGTWKNLENSEVAGNGFDMFLMSIDEEKHNAQSDKNNEQIQVNEFARP